MGFFNRLAHGWNAFMGRDPTNLGPAYTSPPDRPRYSRNGERSIVASIYTRISIDVAAVDIRHVLLDDKDRYASTKKSGLQECLSVEANIDQTGRAFIQSLVMNLLDEGVIAAVPIEVINGDIKSMRVAKVVEYYPRHVRVRLYNDHTGHHEEIVLPKERVAIIENPLYAVMNEYNSTLQRLIRKLNMLDAIDEQASSGKLNLIVQLPYIVKSEARQKQAEKRRQEIEAQLTQSKYGIAYTDGTEKVTQLNRAIENNLLAQIEYYQKMLYNQLGATQEVFDGTADEQKKLNYYSLSVEPILTAIADEFKRKFLSKTARTQGHSIMYFRDQFKLVPIGTFAEIAAKLKQAEIMNTNEFRQVLGLTPDSNPRSEEIANPNINPVDNTAVSNPTSDADDDLFEDNVHEGINDESYTEDNGENQNGSRY